MKPVLVIIQARMGSSRLPGKVLLPLGGTTCIGYQIERMKRARLVDKIVVATSINPQDDLIEQFCIENGVDCFRGDEQDVLDRFYQCAKKYNYDYVARSTADCPLIDPAVIDQTIEHFFSGDWDFCNNNFEATFPDGLDFAVMTTKSIEKAWKESVLPTEREHITMYIIKNSTFKSGQLFKATCFKGLHDYSKYRFTLDEQEDYRLIKTLVDNTFPDAGFMSYISFLNNNQEVAKINNKFQRNEGLLKSLSNESGIKK